MAQVDLLAVTAKDVQRLRQAASVGMMDAKAALTEAGGDFDCAFGILRERGLAASAKQPIAPRPRGGRLIPTPPSRAVTIGAMVELAAETDFVAKSDEFITAGDEIAKRVSWSNPAWLEQRTSPKGVSMRSAGWPRCRPRTSKPEQVIPRIVEGKIKQFLRQSVLYEQEFVSPRVFEGSVGEMVTQLGTQRRTSR